METEHFDCACSSFDHVIRVSLDPDDGDVYIDVRLNIYVPWYKRIWASLKYVLKVDVAFGHYDCTLLKDEDYDRIRDLLKRSEIAKAGNLSRAREQNRQE